MTFGTGARNRCWMGEECEAFIDMAARRVLEYGLLRAAWSHSAPPDALPWDGVKIP